MSTLSCSLWTDLFVKLNTLRSVSAFCKNYQFSFHQTHLQHGNLFLLTFNNYNLYLEHIHGRHDNSGLKESLKASMSTNPATLEGLQGVKSVMVGPVEGPFTDSIKNRGCRGERIMNRIHHTILTPWRPPWWPRVLGNAQGGDYASVDEPLSPATP